MSKPLIKSISLQKFEEKYIIKYKYECTDYTKIIGGLTFDNVISKGISKEALVLKINIEADAPIILNLANTILSLL
jgi:hypothetical protein